MIQLQVLNKVLIDKSLNILNHNGITKDHFSQYAHEYDFITSHYQKYGNVPDDETMLAKFPDFELLNVYETPQYLVETLQEEYLYTQAVPLLTKSAELLQTNAQDAVQYLLPKLQTLIQECTYTAGVDIMADAIARYNEMQARKGLNGLLGITSGLEELDAILGGWLPGEELVTIVGRVNQGKSWILLFFLAMAWANNKKVLLYSGEMGYMQVGYRLDTLLLHVSNSAITRGTMQDDECDSYKDSLERMANSNNPFIVVTPKDLGGKLLNVPTLQSLIEKYKPDIVGIDQISLMEDARSNRDVYRIQVTHIAEDLFRTSEKYGIPILADAQASRKSADKDEPDAPELHEIGESDGIGQYSSRVLSIVQAPSGLKISIKKNRHGANNKNLSYCWDIDKGTFTYLPTTRDNANSGGDAVSASLSAKNRRRTQAQQSQFSDGSEVF